MVASLVISELGIHQGTTDPPHNACHALVVHEAYATRDTFPGIITAFLQQGNRDFGGMVCALPSHPRLDSTVTHVPPLVAPNTT